MSDRILVMNAGRVEQDGSPEELYHHPASRFVADFIGDTNLLSAKVLAREGEAIRLDWQGIPLLAEARGSGAAVGQEVAAALRPESIQAAARPLDQPNSLEAEVLTRTFKGSRVLLEVAAKGRPEARLRLSLDPHAGDLLNAETLWLGWPAEWLAVLRDR